MNSLELRNKILLSMQKALLGMIYPSIRGIAVGFDGTQKLKVIVYLEKEPIEKDFENIRIVTSEVFADIDFKEVDEKCVFTLEPISRLDNLVSWVYLRKE